MIGIGAKMMMGAAGRAVAAVAEWALLHTINNPNAAGTGAGDNFSRGTMSVFGNRVIIGAHAEDVGGSGSGSSYIFDTVSGSIIHTLVNPNASGTVDGDNFGWSNAISSDYAVVSAHLEDVGGSGSGSVYVFDLASGDLLYTLTNPNAASTPAGDNFGFKVDCTNTHIVVGAYLEDNGGTSSGIAYIFDIATGDLLHTLVNPNETGTLTNDFFGYDVGISNNKVIVGAYGEDVGGSESGSAYVFDVTSGDLLYTLTNPNAASTADGDRFGWSVDVTDDHAIVGAYQEDVGGGNSGSAYIFDMSSGDLLHTLVNPNAFGAVDSDLFGYSVGISGSNAIVGAHGEDVGGSSSGSAYIFDVTSGAAIQSLENPNATGTLSNDNFGWSVAISGSYAIVGAYQEDVGGSASGSAYIFAAPPP